MQQRALGEWVRSGGHLILGPGTVLPDGQLADLLPVRYLSVRAVETLPLIAPGVQFPGRVGFGRMLLTGNHDAIVLGDATRPVAVRRREGLGWVTAVAMDLGSQELQRWEGSAALLKSLVAVPRLHHWADRLLERSESVEGMLSSLAGIKVLSRRALLVYVTAVVGVVLVILLVFRLTRLPEWGWALATLVAVGGGCAAVAVANSYKAQPSPFLAELGMVTGCQADRSAVVQAMIGLFSPTEATYRVTATDDFVSLRPGPSRLTPPERFVATYEAQSSLPDLRVRADGIRLMNGRGFINAAHPPDPVVDLPRAVVRAGPAGLAIEIENPTAYRLDDVFLKYHRFVLPLGDLPAGARRVASGLQRGTGSFTSRLVRNPADELRERLRQVFFPAPVFSLERVFSFNERRFQAYFRGQEPRPVLYAWTDHLPALLAVDPPLARRAVGLWAIETDLVFDGERYLVPRGVLDLRLGSRAGATNRAGDGQFFGTRPAELEIDFVLPAGWPDLVIDQARVSLEFRGSAFRPQIALRPVGGGSAVVLTGDPPYTIPEPARFYDQTTRSLRLVLRVESGVSGSRMAETAMLGLTNWQVREVDVELEGTVQ